MVFTLFGIPFGYCYSGLGSFAVISTMNLFLVPITVYHEGSLSRKLSRDNDECYLLASFTRSKSAFLHTCPGVAPPIVAWNLPY